ncbi:MFS transporter [Brackiella oedipodis]|uniref:MFS transporter n=1 Tax=Brackiella oedipodis TaxID=124225 RepID=UPI0004905B81|nr:MFS transporter [Brackiella oedipodis]
MPNPFSRHSQPELSEAATLRIVPLIVGVTLFMQMLDSTIVATALPQMASAFGTTPIRMNVIISSYLLTVAVFVPISGWAADRFGAKRVFFWAVALFIGTSITCALAWDLHSLVFSRILQGLSGAMCVPVGRIIMLRSIPRSKILEANNVLTIPALMGPVLGPPVGGFLVTYASWHWIFLINIPIGLLGLFLIHRYMREFKDEDKPKLDWLGFFLTGISMATFILGIEYLGQHRPILALLLIAIAIVSFTLYSRHAKHHANPILDLELLRIPTFKVSLLAGNLIRLSVSAIPFLLALLLQVTFHYSAFDSGLIILAIAVGSFVAKFVTTTTYSHWGFRSVLLVNAFIHGLLIIVISAFTAHSPLIIMLIVLFFNGATRSLMFTGVNSMIYADIDKRQMSKAGSFVSAAQQIGFALGIGLATLSVDTSMTLLNHEHLQIFDIHVGLWVIGLFSMLSAWWFYGLAADAGSNIVDIHHKPHRHEK